MKELAQYKKAPCACGAQEAAVVSEDGGNLEGLK